MVASQKRRIESPSLVGPIAIGAIIVMLFVGGLKWGKHTQSHRSEETANELHHREEALRVQMDECQLRQDRIIEQSTKLDDFADELKARNRKLELRNKELYAEHSVQEESTAKCQEELEIVTQSNSEAQQKQKMRIKGLHDEVDQLGIALADLTHGQGMRTVLLTQSLKRARASYLRALTALNNLQPQEELVKPPEELLNTWKDALHAREEEELIAAMQMESEVDKWVHWRYDPVQHPNIFLNVVDYDGAPVQPEYFNQHGNHPVMKRAYREPPRVTSLSSQLVELQDFALCALRNNNSNFTFPDKFFWLEANEEDASEMHRIVSTPLVRFCDGCRNFRSAIEFRQACHGDMVRGNYGNYSYWMMRSRIRFLPSVSDRVRDFRIAHDLTNKKYLGVVVHMSENTLKECQVASRRGPLEHFMYVRGNHDEQQLAAVTNDTEARCAPTWPVIVQRILQELSDDDNVPFDAVYLSIEPSSVDPIQLDSISARTRVTMLEPKSAFDEAVDIEIMSHASRIVVSPFLKHSRVTTELFLLNHGLYPEQQVRFW